jgi:hypothetical protein
MGGGLMQLVAYGAQDIYLTGNPQITFFKVVYRRHTNFAMETIEQTINGNVAVNGSSTVTISRNGDLVHKVYVTNSGSTVTTNGSALVSEVELEIGGQRIDKHYEEWNQIWNELSTPESKAVGFKAMIGDVGTSGTDGPVMTQYPLNFWFCRNPGLALPLIALQYHEVKLKFTWGSLASRGVSTDVKVMCDYIYLDTDERRRFAQVSHEYLIEQVQKQSLGGTASEKLNFNHPVKELIWTSQRVDGYTTAKLKLNGHDRFSAQNEEYFTLRQPNDCHTTIPQQNLPYGAVGTNCREAQITKPILDNGKHTDGVGLNNLALGVKDLTWVGTTSGTGPVVMAGGPPEVDAVIVDSTTKSNGFVVGAVDNVSSIVLGTLKQGDIHRITAINDSEMAAADGRGITTYIGTVKYICAGSLRTVAASSGTLGPLDDSIVFDQEMNDDGAALIAAEAILVLYEETFVWPEALETAKDCFLIEKIGEKCARTSKMLKKVNVYSFSLKPEEHQPSGTCNFSRIDNAKLDFTGTQPTSSENVYAVNYNVLRIMSGMGGLAYSN